ncbi:MAG: hypothetical protein Q4E22_04760, partial [Coriobacteriia bacterium]|nr:hypothetical protein [Coriobacteriia bacterium]
IQEAEEDEEDLGAREASKTAEESVASTTQAKEDETPAKDLESKTSSETESPEISKPESESVLITQARENLRYNGSLTDMLIEAGILTINNPPQNGLKMYALVDVAIDQDYNPIQMGLNLAQAASKKNVKALVTQLSNMDDALIVEAQARGFSGTAALDTQVGGYNLKVLLFSDTKGIYGLEGMVAYPELPELTEQSPLSENAA